MTTFAQLAREYVNNGEGQWRSDINAKISLYWIGIFGECPIDEVTVKKIDRWRQEQLAILRSLPSTINRKLAVIKHMFRKAIEWEIIEKNPLEYLHLLSVTNRRLRYLSIEEEGVLTTHLESGMIPKWLRDIVIVGLDTGLRQGELISLRSSDIDSVNDMLVIYQSKTQRTKMIPMTKKVKAVLNGNGITFNHINPRTINRYFNELMDGCEIENFRFHDLRHTFASKLAIKGVPIHVISELLGHTNIQMTMRYAHLSPKAKREAIECLG